MGAGPVGSVRIFDLLQLIFNSSCWGGHKERKQEEISLLERRKENPCRKSTGILQDQGGAQSPLLLPSHGFCREPVTTGSKVPQPTGPGVRAAKQRGKQHRGTSSLTLCLL